MIALRRLVTAFALLAASRADAGPWTKGQGEAYVKLSESVYFAGDFVDPRANVRLGASASSDVEHRSYTTALYAEVGVIEGLHAQLYLPHVVGKNDYRAGGSYLSAGAGDMSLALQWTPALAAFAHALRLEVKIPLYDVADPKGFEGVRFPARGDGQVDATVWASAGGSFAPLLPGYFFGELGHRLRTEVYVGEGDALAFADSLVFAAQAGLTAPFGLLGALNVSGVVPWSNDGVTKGYLNLGGALMYPIAGGFALEANADGTLWAQSSSHGLSLGLGVSYRLERE